MKIRPLGKNVLLKIIQSSCKSGRFFIPFRYERLEAIVEAIGDEVDLVQPGQRVIYNGLDAGQKYKDFLLLHEKNLEALIG